MGSSIDTTPCCEYSFAASSGWDAVTGLGTPNFQLISNLIINNASAFPNLGAYPSGVSQTVVTDTTSDDDEVSTQATVGFALGITGTALGVIAVGTLVYFLVAKKGGAGTGMKESLV